ncbi:MAG: hypothetical protein JWM59_1306 [Verrucomicrobiales bacterium]|nr:hypothetical protein [Verrucomicrobiales bacterium]
MMSPALIQDLTTVAEVAVAQEIELLPETVQGAAAECPVFFTTMALWSRAGKAGGEDDDLLGLFSGASRLEPPPPARRMPRGSYCFWTICGSSVERRRRPFAVNAPSLTCTSWGITSAGTRMR